MGNNYKTERCRSRKLSYLLEASKVMHIVLEILREFVPDKHQFLKLILVNNLANPIAEFAGIHRKTAFYRRNLENLLNKSAERFLFIFAELFQNVGCLVASKNGFIFPVGINIKTLLILFILKISDKELLNN